MEEDNRQHDEAEDEEPKKTPEETIEAAIDCVRAQALRRLGLLKDPEDKKVYANEVDSLANDFLNQIDQLADVVTRRR